jgi:hypothetical protein
MKKIETTAGEAEKEIKEDMPKRRKGGMVPGKSAEMRPDKRARGGATSDRNPLSSAGEMSKPAYESR